jgi:uncharacterized membrane protein
VNIVLALSYFIHLVATIIWIGGLALLVIVVWPATARLRTSETDLGAVLRFLAAMRDKFTPLANISLVALLVTGLIQMAANPHYKGFLQIGDDWSRAIFAKHIAVIGMLVVGLALQGWVGPALERATLRKMKGREAAELPALEQRERQLTALNLVLGVLVLLFTAIATAA